MSELGKDLYLWIKNTVNPQLESKPNHAPGLTIIIEKYIVWIETYNDHDKMETLTLNTITMLPFILHAIQEHPEASGSLSISSLEGAKIDFSFETRGQ